MKSGLDADRVKVIGAEMISSSVGRADIIFIIEISSRSGYEIIKK